MLVVQKVGLAELRVVHRQHQVVPLVVRDLVVVVADHDGVGLVILRELGPHAAEVALHLNRHDRLVGLALQLHVLSAFALSEFDKE